MIQIKRYSPDPNYAMVIGDSPEEIRKFLRQPVEIKRTPSAIPYALIKHYKFPDDKKPRESWRAQIHKEATRKE